MVKYLYYIIIGSLIFGCAHNKQSEKNTARAISSADKGSKTQRPLEGDTSPGAGFEYKIVPKNYHIFSRKGELVKLENTTFKDFKPVLILADNACSANIHIKNVVVPGDLVLLADGGPCGTSIIIENVKARNIFIYTSAVVDSLIEYKGKVVTSGVLKTKLPYRKGYQTKMVGLDYVKQYSLMTEKVKITENLLNIIEYYLNICTAGFVQDHNKCSRGLLNWYSD